MINDNNKFYSKYSNVKEVSIESDVYNKKWAIRD